ncbi:hypothetical protein HHI36_022267 [Cryptolaemus montrouzieri]|uniref:DUF4817 domain-containing protein n=1 Tax=Cryptolaemus montrouzieri TaxID=559131 RepID=A0ABD2N054_9CUCU
MHLIYGECGCNASAAARLYRERYPNAERHPDYRVFVHVHQSYSEGRLSHVRKSAGRPQADYEEFWTKSKMMLAPQRMLAINQEDPQFLDKILWTDETTCKKDGYFNHNLHGWYTETHI